MIQNKLLIYLFPHLSYYCIKLHKTRTSSGLLTSLSPVLESHAVGA